MSAETDPDLPQEPGIPGQKIPDEVPAEGDEAGGPGPLPSEPEVERVPDSGAPDYDEEGSRAPKGAP
jgi:hypothetical protein